MNCAPPSLPGSSRAADATLTAGAIWRNRPASHRSDLSFAMIQILKLATMGEVRPGDDLPAILADALAVLDEAPRSGDVLVVTQKIVSKAEGRYVSLATVVPGPRAIKLAAVTGKDPRLVELVLAESAVVVRAAPNVLITRHRNGCVMANVGIDRSNI